MLKIHLKWILLFMVNLGTIYAVDYHYNISYFDVPLDHFSFTNNKTFQIRVLTNDSYSNGERHSPIFFYTGNEVDIEAIAQNTGFMWEIAPEFDASIVFVEHRYYGKSLPFGNKSFNSPEQSGYLTSEQALADFAQLLNERINPNQRPVIAFGGSYGGMLAAWFRIKYPHLATGAIAASAPILQFITDCSRFNTIVSNVFSVGQGNCSQNVHQTWDVIKKLSGTPDGLNTLKSKFKLCDNITNIQEFIDYLTDVYANLAMVNYPYSADFLATLPPNPVTEFCARIKGTFNDDQLVDALDNALQVYSNYTGKLSCLNIKSLNDEKIGVKGWNFQSCTEMVMPMCTKDDKKSMFPTSSWDFQRYSDDCHKQFKVRPNKNMATTIYGGSNLKYASNIVFSNGLMDPWSGGGVLRTPNNQVKIIIIPDAAHHLDLRARNPNDPASVIAARETEKQEIRKWLSHRSAVHP